EYALPERTDGRRTAHEVAVRRKQLRVGRVQVGHRRRVGASECIHELRVCRSDQITDIASHRLPPERGVIASLRRQPPLKRRSRSRSLLMPMSSLPSSNETCRSARSTSLFFPITSPVKTSSAFIML